MKYMLVGVAALLAGCAMSPQDLKERGTRTEVSSKLDPRAAARCVTTNADRYRNNVGISSPLPATLRVGAAEGQYDVLVAFINSVGYILFAEISPAKSGSKIEAWITTHEHLDEVAGQLLAGCE